MSAVKDRPSYAADEFDAVARGVVPQGVHRAPPSKLRRVLPFLLVLLVFPALAYGAVTLLSDLDSPVLDLGREGVGEDAGGAAPGAEDPAGGPLATPAEPAEPAAAPTTPAESPTEAPDLDRAVQVLNATRTVGLAAGAAERVEGAGFTEVRTGNWRGGEVTGSVVRYPGPQDLATAQAVADRLGIGTVTEVEGDASEPIVVVLAGDYRADG